MRLIPSKFIVSALVVLAFLLLCVRPAQADVIACNQQAWWGQVYSLRGPYSSIQACLNDVASYSASGMYTVSNISAPVGAVGTDTLTATNGTVYSGYTYTVQFGTCIAPQVLNQTTGLCETPPPPLTPQQQAAEDAKNAALAAGHSAAAAQAAADAVNAHYNDWKDFPQTLQGIGAVAADCYDLAVVPDSMAGTMPAANASTIAATSANSYQGLLRLNASAADAAAYAVNQAELELSFHQSAVIAGQVPTPQQFAANVAAGVLTTGAAFSAVTGGASLATAMLASGAIHAAIFAANIDSSNPIQTSAVQAAMAGSVGTTSNPFTVNIVAQAVKSASATATSTETAASVGTATISALTSPNSNWAMPIQPTQTQQAQVSTMAAAAASAATVAANSGMTQSSVNTAAQTAAQAVVSGFSSTDAAVAGQVAAATGSAADGITAAAGSAGTGRIEQLLSDLKAAVGYGQSQAVNDNPAYASGRVGETQTQFNSQLNTLHSQLIVADETDEQSLLGAFVWDPPYAACQPFTGTVHGKAVSIDICSYIDKLRALIGWLFALFGAYSIFQTIFRPRS